MGLSAGGTGRRKPEQRNTLPVPINWRTWQYAWKWLYFYRGAGFFQRDPTRSAAWNRGAYLVNGLGHCSMCHTPLNPLGAAENRYFLTGAFIEGYWAPAITRLGLESASRYEVAEVFAQGRLVDRAGPVRGPMEEANHDSLHYLTESDRLAIAAYLKSVVSTHPRPVPEDIAAQPPLKRGEQVYANVCIMCHLEGEVGAPRIGDQADWEQRLALRGLPALVRHAVDGYNKMPPKGACLTCDDDDIKAGVSYILYHSLLHSQWEELQNPRPAPREESSRIALGQQVYREKCSLCHDGGELGAPRIGERRIWAPLIGKGVDTLILNTLNGIGNMPAKGGCPHCTGSEVIAAVKYLVQQSQSGGNYALW